MTTLQKAQALTKLAFYGPAPVFGAPVYLPPPVTVGQAMTDINAIQALSAYDRRRAIDQIVATGVDVNSPLRNLFTAGLGALAGKTISKALGLSPFTQGVAATMGAQYGYRM